MLQNELKNFGGQLLDHLNLACLRGQLSTKITADLALRYQWAYLRQLSVHLPIEQGFFGKSSDCNWWAKNTNFLACELSTRWWYTIFDYLYLIIMQLYVGLPKELFLLCITVEKSWFLLMTRLFAEKIRPISWPTTVQLTIYQTEMCFKRLFGRKHP